MEPAQFSHQIGFEVRDYECDLQGVVNNANYHHYLEHARHKWLESAGVDFADLHKKGVDLVVSRVEIDYKFPLQSRDRFVVRSAAQKEGKLRIICFQNIYRVPDEKPIAEGRVTVVALQDGRPVVPDGFLGDLAASALHK